MRHRSGDAAQTKEEEQDVQFKEKRSGKLFPISGRDCLLWHVTQRKGSTVLWAQVAP